MKSEENEETDECYFDHLKDGDWKKEAGKEKMNRDSNPYIKSERWISKDFICKKKGKR